jgi:hypothetical protein
LTAESWRLPGCTAPGSARVQSENDETPLMTALVEDGVPVGARLESVPPLFLMNR